MAHRHAHEHDLERAAVGMASVLLQHPDWKVDPFALRDRIDALIDLHLRKARGDTKT